MSNGPSVITKKPPFWAGFLVCAVMMIFMAVLRMELWGKQVAPIGYGLVIVAAGWARDRRLLLGVVLTSLTISIGRFVMYSGDPVLFRQRLFATPLIIIDTILVSWVVDLMIRNQAVLEENVRAEAERRQAAEESTSRKTRFLGAVSHDVRTPANAINLLAELIYRSAGNPEEAAEIPELARELQRCSANLSKLISDVLDLTRLDVGKMELHETEFNLAEWLEEECKPLAALAAAKKLEFRCPSSAPSVRVKCDRVKLSRVLTNLIANAIKFTSAGSINVSAELLPDGRPRITVRDTGAGIPADKIDNIFDEYFQIRNTSRDRTEGSGLGLSISRRLIGAMGGSLDIQSTVGQGSTFSFTLPAACVARSRA